MKLRLLGIDDLRGGHQRRIEQLPPLLQRRQLDALSPGGQEHGHHMPVGQHQPLQLLKQQHVGQVAQLADGQAERASFASSTANANPGRPSASNRSTTRK